MKHKGNSIIGVIGTGRFGLAVAEEILARGKHVIAIDKDPARLRPLSRLNADIFVSADMSKESLEETGIQEADAVVIGIGKDIEIDGGITEENVRRVKDAGANVIVTGNTVFKSDDMAKTIANLRTL